MKEAGMRIRIEPELRQVFMTACRGQDVPAAQVIRTKFPPRALKHVMEWHSLHKDELMQDWELCRQAQQPRPIQPLE